MIVCHQQIENNGRTTLVQGFATEHSWVAITNIQIINKINVIKMVVPVFLVSCDGELHVSYNLGQVLWDLILMLTLILFFLMYVFLLLYKEEIGTHLIVTILWSYKYAVQRFLEDFK